ncbi:DUF6933 domain-containing protein [Desulfurispira natronophila]|uniref:DUF6933 domain-containing protein n=1 Tax=Desulfurispira natronophila TaxID=682562 RepID=A0A7W7Y418_9BACT|nr:hypothetical protein [Desulfurispira natronophila]MBB5021649.1 hypothetical protein [Desulfurispira natronophila]
MIKLHATKKLYEKLPLNEHGLLPSASSSEHLSEQSSLPDNPLSGWHGNLVTFQRRNCVLLAHDVTRFPLLLLNLTKPDLAQLNYYFEDIFMNTLLKCGAEPRHLDAAQQLLHPLQVDSRTSRSELSTLNRMKIEIDCQVDYGGLDIAEMTGYALSARMADVPRSIKGADYIFPWEQMRTLLEKYAGE